MQSLKKNEAYGNSPYNFRVYYKAVVVEETCYWLENRESKGM